MLLRLHSATLALPLFLSSSTHLNPYLEVLIQSLVLDFYQTTGLQPSVLFEATIDLPPLIITALYRIIQEALNNIRKYAEATAVQVHVSTSSSGVYLLVQDDGKGFDPGQVMSGFGLQGIRERVSALRGDLEITSEPGAGCQLVVELPFMPLSFPQRSAEDDRGLASLSAGREAIQIVSSLDSSLSLERLQDLELLLIEQAGLIAPTSPQGLASQTSELDSLLKKLNSYVPSVEPHGCNEQASFLLQNSVGQPQGQLKPMTNGGQDPLMTQSSASHEQLLDRHTVNGRVPESTSVNPSLSTDQVRCLESLLAEQVGPIAPELLKQVVYITSSVDALIQGLEQYMPSQEQHDFKQKATLLLQEIGAQSSITIESEQNLRLKEIDDNFVQYCEEELLNFIGPIASFIIKDALNSSRPSSRQELVNILTKKIPDSNKASEFENLTLMY
jgi:Histidine kinase-, DNA gyrase B-, and HSP90-like ATPase